MTTPGRDAAQLREQLILLAAGCPHSQSNPTSCPLHDVRLLEPAAAIDWVDGLSGEQKDFLMLYHQCCLMINWERDWSGRFNAAKAAAAPVARTAPPSRRKR